ncbi:alpha/beta hydrolase [Pedobacter sp. PAMC26386]|nr:alpha/beta hydrolase [Pedobacter sp. PAMC26386]
MKFLRKSFIVFLSLLVLVMITGLVYEQVSRWQAHKRYNKEQTFADVGGYKLHYNSAGTDTPTVVFESGLDLGGGLSWYKVQPEIAKFASTFSYDRSGILLSERGNKPKTGYQMAVDLHTLLKKTGHNGPYIFVGHSMAGIILPSFVKLYPKEVKGIVYVDCSHPLQVKRFAKYPALTFPTPPLWLVRLSSDFGLTRLLYREAYPSTNPKDSVNVEMDLFKSEAMPAAMEELSAFNSIADSVAAFRNFGDIPLTVITGTNKSRIANFDANTARAFMKIWMELQVDHLKLSTNSKQILAIKSGHYIQLEEPELVVKAVHEMITP